MREIRCVQCGRAAVTPIPEGEWGCWLCRKCLESIAESYVDQAKRFADFEASRGERS